MISDFWRSKKKRIVSKELSQKIKNMKTTKSMSLSRKSDSTQETGGSTKTMYPKMHSPEEVKLWSNIQTDIIERVREKVTVAKQSRLMGFFSPRRLMFKANFVREQNAQKVMLILPTRLCPLSREDIRQRVLSPVFRNRRLIEENSTGLSNKRDEKE